ncbi:MAG TPA: hypothetical protein VFE58_14440 [Tepidisphaeraceae bacterium]|jgi:hypothetical protein|nr:hypothetical protein [Tepidisphaeraceae bacterium]
MADIDTSRLLWIVTGVQLRAELGDRSLAYRIEGEARRLLKELLPSGDGEPARMTPVVVADVYYLNNEDIQDQPVISVGGPGVNAVSNSLLNDVATAVAIENSLLVQMDVEMNDLRCAVWGMDHLQTVQAVDLFLAKGYLEMFIRGVVKWAEETKL